MLTKNFLSKMTSLLLFEAYEYSNTIVKIPSKTLRTFMYIEHYRGENKGYVVVPHYWADYYHNGRGNVYASPSGMLVYYKDPKDDPRIASGYPVTKRGVKRLSPNRFREDARAGKLIVVKSVGPAIVKHPFFDDSSALGMSGFKQRAEAIVNRESDIYVRNLLQSKKLLDRKVTINL